MTLASSPVEHRGWHPVALAATVANAPLAALLLGEPLVLWREAGGVVKAWADPRLRKLNCGVCFS